MDQHHRQHQHSVAIPAQASDSALSPVGSGCAATSRGAYGFRSWCMKGSLMLIAVLCVALVLQSLFPAAPRVAIRFMPRSRRPEGLAERRARAWRRGFVRPRPAARHVPVGVRAWVIYMCRCTVIPTHFSHVGLV